MESITKIVSKPTSVFNTDILKKDIIVYIIFYYDGKRIATDATITDVNENELWYEYWGEDDLYFGVITIDQFIKNEDSIFLKKSNTDEQIQENSERNDVRIMTKFS